MKELDHVLSSSAGLSLQDGVPLEKIIRPETTIDLFPDLVLLESDLVRKIRNTGKAEHPLSSQTARKFVEVLGPAMLLLLKDPRAKNKEYFATVHPATDFVSDELVLTILGNGDWIPKELDPSSGQTRPDLVWLALSAQNRLATTGAHDGRAVVADPLHVSSTLAASLKGSRIRSRITALPEVAQHHFADDIKRGVAQTFSARIPTEQGTEMWRYPVTTISYSADKHIPYTVVFLPDLLDAQSFSDTGIQRIIPLRAYEPSALIALQLESYEQVDKHGGSDDFVRKVVAQLEE